MSEWIAIESHHMPGLRSNTGLGTAGAQSDSMARMRMLIIRKGRFHC